MFRVLLILACCAVSTAARAHSRPGNPDALGTERVLATDTAISARVARKQFSGTLPLEPKEVTATPAVLDVFNGRAEGPVAPSFRFPGFASSPALLDRLNSRGIVIFGANFWASDWSHPDTHARTAFGYDAAASGGRRYRALSRPQIRNRRHAAGVA